MWFWVDIEWDCIVLRRCTDVLFAFNFLSGDAPGFRDAFVGVVDDVVSLKFGPRLT